MKTVEFEWQVIEGDDLFATGTALTVAEAVTEANHYAAQCFESGGANVHISRVEREEITSYHVGVEK